MCLQGIGESWIHIRFQDTWTWIGLGNGLLPDDTKQTLELICRHYNDVRMGAMASQITSLTIVYWSVYSGADQRKHQSSASLAFVRGIHRRPVNSPHKWPATRKMFPFDDVIMWGMDQVLSKNLCVNVLMLDYVFIYWLLWYIWMKCPNSQRVP